LNGENLQWGDIHNHNEIGVGQGSLERSYAIARASLDFYALTVHGWWPDADENDPELIEYHLKGFHRADQDWPRVVAEANEVNKDGRFTALIAYEWHSRSWGDYCIYFPDHQGTLYRADSLDDLKQFARENGCLMLPHHGAYKAGWRGVDWGSADTGLSPTTEIFSEHGNSLEPISHLGLYRHSMGGAHSSQTVLEQLKRGAVLGFTGGTDDHYGFPGNYGEGLTGLYTEELSRAGVFAALKKRHCYAVTGDRIELSVRLGSGIMGDILPAATERVLQVDMESREDIDYLEIVKNGVSQEKWSGPNLRASSPDNLLRIEWGWDGMKSQAVTRWEITISAERGRVTKVEPCFCGGPDTAGITDTMELTDSGKVIIASHSVQVSFSKGVGEEIPERGFAPSNCTLIYGLFY